MGYDPLALIDGLDRVNKIYAIDPAAYHPPNRIRKQIILGVLPTKLTKTLPDRKLSPQLLALKETIAKF